MQFSAKGVVISAANFSFGKMRPLFASLLFWGGIALGVVGLILWRILPIPANGPPFVLTPILAVGLGVFDWYWQRTFPPGDKQP